MFAVRGTVDALDLLEDISLWFVPGLLQIFNFVGLDVSFGSWGKAMVCMSSVIPLAKNDRQKTFDPLLQAAKSMMKQYPERRYLLTGHSLGGGVAKLVQILLGTKTMAVTFSAPGIHYAQHSLGNDVHEVSASVITVKPDGDLISRIDIGTGTVIHGPCQGTALQCHSIYRTLWNLLHLCGASFSVPCGWSEAPC